MYVSQPLLECLLLGSQTGSSRLPALASLLKSGEAHSGHTPDRRHPICNAPQSLLNSVEARRLQHMLQGGKLREDLQGRGFLNAAAYKSLFL